jgi:acetoin utilization deacetylase AcuC-like enzyme
MGFCLFNNVAVGAAHALARGLERVLVVDFDVHHGNGTQEIFYRDPRVLYLSTHEFPFYPGTGAVDEVGEGAGRGFTVNLPLPAGCGDAEYALLYREIAEPVARAFDPQLVMVSAGFDAHAADPLAGMNVTERGFSSMIRSCLRAAAAGAGGRTIVVLEGGYDLDAVAASAATVVASLVAEDGDVGGAISPTPMAQALVLRYRRAFEPRWPSLRA